MTVLFLVSGELDGIADLDARVVFLGGKKYDLPPGTVLKSGDSLVLGGNEFVAADFIPGMMDIYSERKFQSIKAHDASYMISMSGIHSGSKVIESGMGNGTFSAHILQSVSPSGTLTSIDVSDEAIASCRESLSKFFSLENWNALKGDIRKYTSDSTFDAGFLDIPDPWNAIDVMRKIIKPGGSLVVYSPNYNQIEKSVLEMEKNGFAIRETVEILKRNILVREGKTRPDQRMIGHTAFITFGVRKSGFSLRIK